MTNPCPGARASAPRTTRRRPLVRLALSLLLALFLGAFLGTVLPIGGHPALAYDAPPKDQGHDGSDNDDPDDDNPDDPDQDEEGDPVQVQTGNFIMAQQDFFLKSFALPTVIQRSYNSLDTIYDGPLGKGWSLSFVMQLTEVTEYIANGDTITIRAQVVIRDDAGKNHTFYPVYGADFAITGYTSANRARYGTLTRTGDTSFTWTRVDGMQFRFTSGRLAEIRDPNGNRITTSYDGLGRLASVTNPAGRRFDFTYNAASKLARITDPLGRTVTYGYDSANRLTSVTNPVGAVTTMTYGTDDRLATMTSPRGHQVLSNTYDGAGRVTRQVANGATYTYSYNTGYTSVTNSRSATSLNYFNDKGNPIQLRDHRGFNSYMTWSDNGDLLSFRDQRNFTTSMTYDATGNVATVTKPDGGVARFTYGALSRPARMQDALGRVSTLSYDTRGNLTGTVDPLGQTESFTYDSAGRILTATDKAGTTVTYGYDAAGNMTSYVDELGRTQTYTYDAVGRRLTETNPAGETTSTTYDARDRVVAITDPLGQTTSFGYDGNNDLTSVTDPLGQTTTYAYTPFGFRSSMTDPLGNVTTYEYDSLSNMTATTDPDGRRSTMTYDAGNLLTRITRPDASVINYAYDGARNLITVTDPRGNITRHTYDGLNRRIGTTFADTTTEATVYDLVGSVVRFTDRAGKVYTSGYDALDRLVSQGLPNDGTITTAYNPLNRVTSVAGYAGTINYTYDALQRMTSETGVWGETVRYSHDAADRLVRMERPSRYAIDYSFDADGRMVAATSPAGTATYTHDADDRLVREVLPNGIVITYSYDAADRLTRVTHQNPAGTLTLLSHAYDYNKFGLITAMTDAEGNRTAYTYNNFYRLTGETVRNAAGTTVSTTTYTYDANGNRLTRTDNGVVTAYTYSTTNAMLTETGATYGYDANGNLTSAVTAAGTVTYAYDDLDRLVSVSGGGLVPATYAYDASGRRVRRTFNGTEQRFVHSERAVIEELSAAGVPVARYDHLNGLTAMDDAGGLRFYNFDGIGHTRALSDQSAAITDRYTMTAFGDRITHTGPSANPFVYKGVAGYYDEGQDALMQVGARYLDASAGRFLQWDPARQGHNPYGYAFASPVSMDDPSGEIIPFLIGACLRGGAMGALEDEAMSGLDGSHKDRSNWDRAGSFALGCLTGGFGNKARRAGRAADAIADAARRNPCSCFVAGTPVKTKDGVKPIETIAIGDMVWAQDPVSGAQELKLVTATIIRPVEDVERLYKLTIDAGDGRSDTLVVTGEHPFWVPAKADWVAVDDLTVGDRLTNHKGEVLTLAAKTPETDKRETYNLTVEGFESYFAGSLEVLVHNAGPCRLPPDRIQNPPTKRGNAPIGDDGKPVELHHDGQRPDSPLQEMTRTDHRGGDNFAKNHDNTGQSPSQIDRNQWRQERTDYWRGEWDSGRWD